MKINILSSQEKLSEIESGANEELKMKIYELQSECEVLNRKVNDLVKEVSRRTPLRVPKLSNALERSVKKREVKIFR